MLKVLLLCFLLLQTGERSPFKGEGIGGGGRACIGDLRVYPGYLNWETSFSTCDHMTYKTLKKEDGLWVYHLDKKKGCLYSILEVKHLDEYDWDVMGYTTIAAWRQRKTGVDFFIECGMN